MKVLIVEDSEPMRRTIKSFIEDLACQVYECADGRDALAEFARRRPDWVLMDIKMRDVDGLAAARQIKSAFPDARIVMVTSYDEESFRDEARLAGACGYVLKESLRDLAKIIAGGDRRENSIDQ
jgi:two-component system NarL family response regulator